MFLDLENRFAALPGDGTTPLVLTHSRDAGRFTAALLDVPRWKTRYAIIGIRTTLIEAVRAIEAVLGTPLDVHYDSLSVLREGKATLTPRLEAIVKGTSMEPFMMSLVAQTGLLVNAGEMDLQTRDNLTKMFPDIKPLGIRDVAEAWR